jgi:hypothetical protein
MDIHLPEELGKVAFLIYVVICLWFTSITTAFLIVPLILISNMCLFNQPPQMAICLISDDPDKCMLVMKEVAKSVGADQVIVYKDVGSKDDYQYLGEVNLLPEVKESKDQD